MKRIKERLCSIMLCVAMVAGIIPLNGIALAAVTQADQIGNHYQADQQTGVLASVPELSGDTSKSYADDWLRTNKTISPGENENEFLITLDVRTKSEIRNIELSEDAAVVLAIDLSGSMKEDNRLEKAKQAALEFIEKFSVTDHENTLRKIAVVGFSGQQEISGGWGFSGQKGIVAATTYQSWTDAGDTSIRSAIEEMNAEGGTCLQAGLILAKNLFDSDEIANIESKNIVVLTDGRPTYYLTETAAKDSSDRSIGAPETIQGTGSSTDHNTHTKTENTAKAVLATGIHVYGIFLGNDSVNCSGRSCNLRKTGADWLRENCGFLTYAVENAGDLSSIFENISELIQLQAKAWIAEDPMGEMFDFSGFVKEPEDKNEYFYNTADRKIGWNLRLSSPDGTTEDGFSIYRLIYKARLNTLAPDYTANRYYPTNGITSVTWLIEKSTESGVSEIDSGVAHFNVPSAKGYAADISFRKTDGNGQPLAGAEFGLYHEDTLITSAMSDGTGTVLFENVPSGHFYTILEESAPEGFVASTEKYNIEVAYGNLIGTIGEDNTVINYKAGEPTPPAVGIDITKTVRATGDIIPDFENIFGFVVSRNLPGTASEAEIVATPLIAITGTGTDSVGYEFDKLEFTENGTATFYVWEMPQDSLFWNYDETLYRVTFIRNWETGEVDREYAKITSFVDKINFEPVTDISFTNIYHYEEEPVIGTNGGDLIISKTVSRGDKTKAFTFTVTLDNPEVNGKYGDIVFTDGVAVLLLKDGESATAEELPANIGYTVRESDNDGYTVTVNGTGSSIAEGKIAENETAVAAFQNDKIPDTGSVKITKTVTGNKAPTQSIPYSFRAWVRDGGGNAVSESVSYTITKADGTTESGTATIAEDGYMFSLKDGESILFSGITDGRRFEVREISTGAFSTTVDGLIDGVCGITPNGTATIAFFNDYGDSVAPPVSTPESSTPDIPYSPQTGDSSKIQLWMILACVSLLGFISMVFVGKKQYIQR